MLFIAMRISLHYVLFMRLYSIRISQDLLPTDLHVTGITTSASDTLGRPGPAV